MNNKKITDVNEMTRGLDIEYGVFRRSKLPQMNRYIDLFAKSFQLINVFVAGIEIFLLKSSY